MKKFTAIWCGELISCIGSGMTSFAISVYMYQLTGSTAFVSMAALFAYLPGILLNPLGGVLADRYDRRWMMILGDSLSAIGLVIILFSIQSGSQSPLLILLGIVVSSVFGAMMEPAYKATVSDLLTEDEYAKASGMVQLAGNARYLISPAAAGLLLAVSDIRLILVFDILTFAVTVITVGSVRKQIVNKTQQKISRSFFSELKEGWYCIQKDPEVRSLVLLMGCMCFFLAFLQTLMTPMALAFTDSKTIGMLESVSAVGMVIGCIVIGIMKLQKGYTKILKGGLMAAGVFMALCGTTTNLWLLLTFCICFFCSLPWVNTCADVLIRKRIPNELQGRAWGIISLLSQIGYVAAYAVCGILADHVFNPMLMDDGILADSLGRWIGTGEGRGIGLMLMISGMMMFGCAFVFTNRRGIQNMEERKNELVAWKE